MDLTSRLYASGLGATLGGHARKEEQATQQQHGASVRTSAATQLTTARRRSSGFNADGAQASKAEAAARTAVIAGSPTAHYLSNELAMKLGIGSGAVIAHEAAADGGRNLAVSLSGPSLALLTAGAGRTGYIHETRPLRPSEVSKLSQAAGGARRGSNAAPLPLSSGVRPPQKTFMESLGLPLHELEGLTKGNFVYCRPRPQGPDVQLTLEDAADVADM